MQTHVAGSQEASFDSTSANQATTQRSSTSIRQTSFAGIISECSSMQKVFSVVEKVARTDTTVLVLGESGTGKELIARAVHKLSGRTGKLVPVNCGAIPEEILESELFGHEKGSFTGAINSKIGRFQLADNGTIFLDEIGEMSPKLQVKLLRVLQERKVEPVGSTRTIDINVRVIAATNKDLKEEVKAGRFREDLFYRLQVVPIELPALRARGNDIEILVEHFMARACGNLSKPVVEFSPEAMKTMQSYPWPGNVRELENLIERLAILADTDRLLPQDLPDYLRGQQNACEIIELGEDLPSQGVDFNDLVEKFETRLISMALSKTNWNKKAAARLLHLNRTTLVEKIKKKGLAEKIEVTVEDDRDDAAPAMMSGLFRLNE
ncbi:MAG: sigma-54-dependent Fis family transcriptional regulator [Deltaproteobacteria bacterium]|nr:sigma-54-dependent Fis family transcriptional regulator [Deltaproteobacteria bacterium]